MCAEAIVADIQRASIHDGPGLRTTVFFKGCPLHCVWCHNPECIEKKPQTLFYPEKCIGCGKCAEGCFAGARVLCGRKMTAEEIFAEILADKASYGENGGATFSGGEPLLYPAMLKALTALCHREGITAAVETSLFFFDPEIFADLDYIMADFKIFDSTRHAQYTGVKNERIKENFRKLDALGVPFLVRTPIIPGINDTKEEISHIRDFLCTLRHVTGYELLPYHPLGVPKQAALGLPETRFEIPAKTEMEELKHYADIRRPHTGNQG